MNTRLPLRDIKGVGPKLDSQYRAIGIATIGDLIHFFPFRHTDFSQPADIASLKPGAVTFEAELESISTSVKRRAMKLTEAVFSDATGKVRVVWFNQPYRAQQLHPGKRYVLTGKLEFRYNRYQITNPNAESAHAIAQQSQGLLPIYHQPKGVKQQVTYKLLKEARPLMRVLPETLPSQIVTRQQLMSYANAVETIHFPEDATKLAAAKQRLAFDELFELLVGAQLNRQENTRLRGWQIPHDLETTRHFVEHLPFSLTDDQRRVAWEIIQDLQEPHPMNRLLQGDVGSGKTVVAALIARQVAHHQLQTALMAPTEILAQQHAKTLADLLEPAGVRVGLLTGSVKGKQRQALLAALAAGEIDVVVGTHALIQPTIVFHKLGFVVVDEQHRFGVEQRHALLKKSRHMPHLLAMSATPIPRSLALTLYGEMDLSIITTLPAGRRPIETKIWTSSARPQLYQAIAEQLKQGRQAYVICSLVAAGEDERKSAEDEYQRLQKSLFRTYRIGLLHGKLDATQKREVMKAFSKGEIDILVGTTVVEVGVDVPNATVMLIEDAEQFGLSQLHQLRGRVGRGQHQSYCHLMTNQLKKPSKRLQVIEQSSDGFYLAEVDLELRGPGEIYGRAQHGDLNLQIATLGDSQLIARAAKEAKWFVKTNQDLLQYKQLADRVRHFQKITTLN